MKTISKILSVVLVLTMVLGLVGMVSAAETTETQNVYGNKGTKDGKTITWTFTNFTFMNEQDKSQTAIRNSDTDHFRVYQDSKTTITALNGQVMTKIVVTVTESKYASVLKTSVEKVAGTTDAPSACDHSYTDCDDTTCDKCGNERTAVPHAYDSCEDTDCNTCGKTREAAEHVYTNEYDASCNT